MNNNCLYCQSGIDKTDKVCSRCGAPNKNYNEQEHKKYPAYTNEIIKSENIISFMAGSLMNLTFNIF